MTRESSSPTRIGIVADLAEEGWPSMDLVAAMLVEEIGGLEEPGLRASLLRPAMRRRFSGPGASHGRGFTADRFLNRLWDYPRWLRRRREAHDLFHLVDHSYSQLVHELPADRVVVTCHDLDTFRCLLDPAAEPRGAAFRWMVRRILRGFRAAAHVACPSAVTRDALLARGLHSEDRVTVVENGVHPACRAEPDPPAEARIGELLGSAETAPPRIEEPELLHVGSIIPRKRIDILLRAFAEVRRELPGCRLLRVGGGLSPEQARLADELGVAEGIVDLPYLEPRELAAAYRRAALVLQPSESEGFGLPVAEAMACGTPVVASRLPVLMEVAGDAAVYCPVGEPEAWAETVLRLLRERRKEPEAWAGRVDAARRRAERFSWRRYARKMCAIYSNVLEAATSGSPPRPAR